MSDRPDNVRCVLSGRRDGESDSPERVTWCGRHAPSHEWVFTDPTHAALSGVAGTLIVPCLNCVERIVAALRTEAPPDVLDALRAAEVRYLVARGWVTDSNCMEVARWSPPKWNTHRAYNLRDAVVEQRGREAEENYSTQHERARAAGRIA